MAEWLSILGVLISTMGGALTAYLLYRTNIEKTEREEHRMRMKDRIDGDAELREDLMKIIEDHNKRNADLIKMNREQQDFIDQQIVKRRMEAQENDRLTRIIKDLREENDSLQARIACLEKKVQELQDIVESTR
jgi:predicted RNase H-like nuclease (RuvC/YqgF family)